MPAAALIATSLSQLPQFLATGLTLGSIYALVAVSFVLIYNVTGVINFAQGEFVMLGMMITIEIAGQSPVSSPRLLVAVVVAVAMVAALGAVVERVALHPRATHSAVILLIITIGVSGALRGGALLRYKSTTYSLRPFTNGPAVTILGAVVKRQTFWVLGITAVSMVALWLFFDRTRVGKAFRACEINPLAARLVGIRPRRYWTFAFALSAGLAALGGATLAPITFATYDIGLGLGLKAFAAWILGGIHSAVGAVIGGFTIGILEALSNGYAPAGIRRYLDAIPFVILILVLIARPGGLTGAIDPRRV